MSTIDKSDFDLIGGDDEPAQPHWLGYPIVVMHLNDGTFHADVINHYSGRLNEADDITDSHETTHMINADLRNAHVSATAKGFGEWQTQIRRIHQRTYTYLVSADGSRNNAFYVGNSKAIVLPEPGFRKSSVAAFVPSSLQGFRYATYVTGMPDWDDSPFYLHDEQIAYTNGGATGVEEVEKGTYRGEWTDGVSGCLEFAVYTSALFLAIEQNDPSYLKDNPEYLQYMNWVLQRGHDIYVKGSVMTQFKWDTQDKYLDNLKNESEASEIRRVLKDYGSNAFLT